MLFKHLLVFCSGVKVNTCISKVALKMTYQNPNFCVEFIAWAKSISLTFKSSSTGEEDRGDRLARAFAALRVLKIL